MKITIESTDEIVEVNYRVQARVWQGVTDSGIRVQCLVTRIAVFETEDCRQFEEELKEQPAPVVLRDLSDEPPRLEDFSSRRAFPLRILI